jgi:hypothetical protein
MHGPAFLLLESSAVRLGKFGLTAVLIVFCLALGAAAARAGTVTITLNWDSSGKNVSGYKVYYGTAASALSNSVAVVTNSAAILNLASGVRYYFAVTAVDTMGLEGTPSPTISAVAGSPLPPARIGLLRSGAATQLNGTAPAGYTYDLLASADMKNWSKVGALTADASGALQAPVSMSGTNGAVLYRLRQAIP